LRNVSQKKRRTSCWDGVNIGVGKVNVRESVILPIPATDERFG
jgi:hypothetical protein